MAKIPVSFEWLSGCSGCELSIVDLHERLLTVLDSIDIVRLPILSDTKDYPKAKIGIITGALRTDHDVHCAHKMRETCDTILAFGICAVFGGPQGSGYAHTLQELENASFVNNPTTTTKFVPDQNVPKLLAEGVRPIDSEIKVDLYLPGCPPHPFFVFEALSSILENRAPDFEDHNVCFNCDRKMSHSELTQIRRIHQGTFDDKTCFLSQGCLCMGSATMDRCLAPCPTRGIPCSGCAGPSEAIIVEPSRDIRTEVATRMAKMTKIPEQSILSEIEAQAKTYYAYAMASPIFREKPTFLLRKWISSDGAKS
jgi:F420-non-reducing hydrogenase small subunit